MQLTSRDMNLFRWINGFGFVFTGHIAQWMGVRYQTANARVRKLKSEGLLYSEHTFCRLPHLLFLTQKAWGLTEEALPRLLRLGHLHTLNHDLRLIDLSLELTSQHEGSQFVPERRIRYDKSGNNISHYPDGYFYLKGYEKPIAIELELTQKKATRLQSIIRNYRASFDYEAVWYFTSSSITAKVTRLTTDDPLFRVNEIEYTPCL
ncbi:MAG: hypothetical protein ACRBBN_05475 [Methyloligellaceae bacterium]